MSYARANRLEVSRTLSDGSSVSVGTLAQNEQGIYFQFHTQYLNEFQSLSPFNLRFDSSLQLAPNEPHKGLHGAFSDSLPDGWGLLLMDRIFRQADILPAQITAMDRLSFIGNRAVGALSYQPISELQCGNSEEPLTIAELGLQAQAIFDGQTSDILHALVNAGSSGGARPKVQLYLNNADTTMCSTTPTIDSDAYLVKFTSSQLLLGHEEGLCEAAYLTMAKNAGIDAPGWTLLDAPQSSGAKKWLALKRFDTIKKPDGVEGRLHLHSACGLLDADYRMPSLDYEDLIKASSLLCKSPASGQAMFRRMVFNLFAVNQDDHSKNWAFLQNDHSDWELTPFYDVTFSPSAYNEHATAFCGFGRNPSAKVMQKLANHSNFSSWKQAQHVITEVVDEISTFSSVAKDLQVSPETIKLINTQLDSVYKDNKALLQK